MQAAFDLKRFSGVMMVVHHGKVILHQGYGMATIDDKNERNTVFHIASITKQFTAAAIMKLWEAGKIDLNTSINKYLPKKYQSDIWEKVTAHHLLSHTSGIVDYDEKYYDSKTLGFCSEEIIAKLIKETGQKKLEFEPGTNYDYCNIGYTLLGIMLENQTGKSYPAIIKEYFLIPLEMSSTSFHEENYVAKKVHATGFRWNFEDKKWVEDSEKILGTVPDGGMLTTVEDLYKWSVVIAGKRPDILSLEILKLMTTPVPKTFTEDGGYGYGLGIDDSSGIRRIHHSGWMTGFMSFFCLYPEKEMYISLFCNNTTSNLIKIASGLAEIMGEKSFSRV